MDIRLESEIERLYVVIATLLLLLFRIATLNHNSCDEGVIHEFDGMSSKFYVGPREAILSTIEDSNGYLVLVIRHTC